jgi:hypothetical protein
MTKRFHDRKGFIVRKRHPLRDPQSGASMIYDPEPYEVVRWMNRRLRKHNMEWVPLGFGPWSSIVQLDITKPLPKGYFMLGENIWATSGTYRDDLVKKGRVSEKWDGTPTFVCES